MARLRILIATLAAIATLVCAWTIIAKSSEFSVELVNGGNDMKDVRVVTGSFEIDFSQIKAGASERFAFNPANESDILISFTDSTGTAISKRCDVYLERGGRGSMQIGRSPRNQVVWIGIINGLRTAGIAD